MFGTGLLIFLESSDDSGAVINREESCLVGEIVDHPVRNDAHDYGDQAFKNENPSLDPEFVSMKFQDVAFLSLSYPTWLAPHTLHLSDSSCQKSTE